MVSGCAVCCSKGEATCHLLFYESLYLTKKKSFLFRIASHSELVALVVSLSV